MNNEEAKFILQGYRPNGADAGDATFCAAVEQARKDPALGEWFARQQAFDSALSAKLQEVSPPAGLREAILAGGQVTESGRPVQRVWIRPFWMGMAASVAVLVGVGLALWPKQASAFAEFAVADSRLSATHGGHGHENNQLQALLNSPATRLGQKLPLDFAQLTQTGCRTVRYHDKPVLELCFSRDGVWYHCYIARAADFPQLAQNGSPHFVEEGSMATASWADGEHIISVVSKTGRKDLERLL